MTDLFYFIWSEKYIRLAGGHVICFNINNLYHVCDNIVVG